MTIALCVACVQRWSALRRIAAPDTNRWWTPGLQAQRLARLNALHGGAYPATSRGQGVDTNKPQHAVLPRHTGPGYPVRSIRLAISPLTGPNTRRALGRTILFSVLAVAVLLVLLTQHLLSLGARNFVARLLPVYGFLFLGEGILGSGLGSSRSLISTRWTGHHGELPLLALLPNLVRRGACKRAILFAGLHGRAIWLACVLIALALVAATLHMPAGTYPILLVTALSGLALDAAIALHMLAGRPLRGARRYAYSIAFLVLVVGGATIWGAAVPDATPETLSPHGAILLLAVFALWSAWLLVLAGFAWRGWRLLQRRPHPFLANLHV